MAEINLKKQVEFLDLPEPKRAPKPKLRLVENKDPLAEKLRLYNEKFTEYFDFEKYPILENDFIPSLDYVQEEPEIIIQRVELKTKLKRLERDKEFVGLSRESLEQINREEQGLKKQLAELEKSKQEDLQKQERLQKGLNNRLRTNWFSKVFVSIQLLLKEDFVESSIELEEKLSSKYILTFEIFKKLKAREVKAKQKLKAENSVENQAELGAIYAEKKQFILNEMEELRKVVFEVLQELRNDEVEAKAA